MEESPFVKMFEEAANEIFNGKFVVKKGANLFYELTLNRELKLSVGNTEEPKRGDSAFQTDLCVFEKIGSSEFPRVAIEFKTNITTHDVITYSAKAGKHKKIYPGLRYGLLASEIDAIPNRFFIHNENLDFFIAAKQYKEAETGVLKQMIKSLIETEVTTAQTLEKIYFDKDKFNYYKTDIIFKKF